MAERDEMLIAEHLAGALDDAAGEVLVALVRRDPAVAAELARQRAIDAWLHAHAAGPLDVALVLRALPADRTSLADRVMPRLGRRARRVGRPARGVTRALASAAMILVALGAALCWPGRPAAWRIVASSGIATIDGSTSRAAARGGDVHVGERVALAPDAALTLIAADGSTLEVAGGAALTIDPAPPGGETLRLEHGRLAATAAASATGAGLRIVTAHAEAVAAGARFALDVDATRTRLRVERGEARFTPRGGVAVAVGAGGSAVAPDGADADGRRVDLHPVELGYADEEQPGSSFPGSALAVRAGDGARRTALVRFAVPAGAPIAAAEIVLHRHSGVGTVTVCAQPLGTWTSHDLRFYHVPDAGAELGPLREVDGVWRLDVLAAVRAGTAEFLLRGEPGTDCWFETAGDAAPTLRLTIAAPP